MAFASFSLSNCYWNMVRPWPSPFKENQFNYCYLTRFNSAMNIHGVQYHAINQRWRHTIKNLLPLPLYPSLKTSLALSRIRRANSKRVDPIAANQRRLTLSRIFARVTTSRYQTTLNPPPPPSSIPHPAPQKRASIASENPWRGCRKLDRGWWTGLNIHQGAVMTSRDEGRWQHPQHL